MTCPTCHRPSSLPATFSGGNRQPFLCTDPFHAAPSEPLPRHWLATTDNPRPDDHPAPTSQGGPVAAPTFASNYSRSPYDPAPPAKTPATNGYIRCPDC